MQIHRSVSVGGADVGAAAVSHLGSDRGVVRDAAQVALPGGDLRRRRHPRAAARRGQEVRRYRQNVQEGEWRSSVRPEVSASSLIIIASYI